MASVLDLSIESGWCSFNENAHPVYEAINHIPFVFENLMKGELGKAAYELACVAPVVGAFLGIYVIFNFLGSVSVFRKPGQKRFAHLFGLSVAMMGILNKEISTFMINVIAGSFLQLILVILGFAFVVFMFQYVLTTYFHLDSENTKSFAKAAAAHSNKPWSLPSFSKRNRQNNNNNYSSSPSRKTKYYGNQADREAHHISEQNAQNYQEEKKVARTEDQVEQAIYKDNEYLMREGQDVVRPDLLGLGPLLYQLTQDTKDESSLTKANSILADVNARIVHESKIIVQMSKYIDFLGKLELSNAKGEQKFHVTTYTELRNCLEDHLKKFIESNHSSIDDDKKKKLLARLLVHDVDKLVSLGKRIEALDKNRFSLLNEAGKIVAEMRYLCQEAIRTLEDLENEIINENDFTKTGKHVDKLIDIFNKIYKREEEVHDMMNKLITCNKEIQAIEEEYHQIVSDLTDTRFINNILNGDLDGPVEIAGGDAS